MEVGIVEFVLDLLQHVVINVGAFLRGMTVVRRVKFNRSHFAVGKAHFVHAVAGEDKKVIAFVIGNETAAYATGKHLGVTLLQVTAIEICSGFCRSGAIIEFVAFL